MTHANKAGIAVAVMAAGVLAISVADAVGRAGTGGSAHSVAADPFENEAYVPIPSNAGSTICPTANGCVAVFKAPHDDDRVFVRRDHDDDHDHDHD